MEGKNYGDYVKYNGRKRQCVLSMEGSCGWTSRVVIALHLGKV